MLREGERVSDTQFDKVFPVWLRQLGERHWTSVAVALRAARFLAEGTEPARILDLGAGTGKFCIVGALSTRAHFTGIERRRNLVDLARGLSRELKIERAKFLWADFLEANLDAYTGAYLFNPFEENIDPSARIDDKVPCGPEQHSRYIAATQAWLEKTPPGFRLAVYYGFGGRLPASFAPQEFEAETTELRNLKLFVKQSPEFSAV